jgi:hypothetical protein
MISSVYQRLVQQEHLQDFYKAKFECHFQSELFFKQGPEV